MALRDKACYTLTLNPSTADPNMLELLEPPAPPSGKADARYVRMRETRDDEAYSGVIYDAFSGAKLASMGYPAVKDKKRRLELHGPDESVGLEFTGKINFEWSFVFEGNKYRWNKELYGKDYICSVDRKPDPRVEVCLARDADSKNPGRLQILHYNLDRFSDEIKDLRGLETLLVASLIMLVDAADERASRPCSTSGAQRPALHNSGSSSSSQVNQSGSLPPPVPEKPAKVISEEDYEPVSCQMVPPCDAHGSRQENPNEIVVGTRTNIDEHVARAVGLLEDPHTLFVVVRTRNAAATQRALEVSLGVTRFRHRENMGDLHQYVIEEEPFGPSKTPAPAASGSSPSRQGPRVINLDEPAPAPKSSRSSSSTDKPSGPKWAAPPNIAIYLSKIELPDLEPGRRKREGRHEGGSATANGTQGGLSSGRPAQPPRPVSPAPPTKLVRPPQNAPRPGIGSSVRPPPPSISPNGGPPPPGVAALPPPPAGSEGSQARPSAGAGGGISLTRLFKAAASKV